MPMPMPMVMFTPLADRWPELVGYLAWTVALAALLIIDLAVQRLPDRIVGPGCLIVLAGLTGQALMTGEWGRLLGTIGSAAVVLIGYFLLGLVGNGRLGLGDVKLSGLLGLGLGWLGLPQTVLGVLLGPALGAVVSAILLIIGRSRRSDYPFGPCMIIGAVLGAVLAPMIW